MGILDDIIGDIDHTALDLPASVRTPGRTWTEMPVPEDGTGNGTVRVEAPDTVEALSLRDAVQRNPERLREALFQGAAHDSNVITGKHANALEEGVYVRVPDGTVIEEQVRIVTAGEGGFFPHHVLVDVGDGATVTVVERNTGDGMDSAFTEAVVGKEATLDYTKVNDLGDVVGYAENAARVEENGTVRWTVVSTGSSLYKNRTATTLAGPRSTLAYDLGFMAAEEQHMDLTSHVIHAADNTRCDMDSRGVALDRARTIYKGVQEVMENAEGTKSFQDERTVMIGNECEADTTPQLRIDNNEVEATHAATTGHVDEKDLFYMRSRGVTEKDAVREIVTGMFADLTDGKDGMDAVERKIAASL